MFLKQTLQNAPEGSGDIRELQYPTEDTHLNPLLCTVEFFLLFLLLLELRKHFTGGLSFHHQNYKLFRPVRVCSQPFRHHQNFPRCNKRSHNSRSNTVSWHFIYTSIYSIMQRCPTEEAKHKLQEGSYAGCLFFNAIICWRVSLCQDQLKGHRKRAILAWSSQGKNKKG